MLFPFVSEENEIRRVTALVRVTGGFRSEAIYPLKLASDPQAESATATCHLEDMKNTMHQLQIRN